MTVALELEVTPELRREGVARELVRTIQEARKEAGLEVTDRIELGVETSGEPAEALAAHRDEIAEETLASELRSVGVDGFRQESELDGVAGHRESQEERPEGRFLLFAPEQLPERIALLLVRPTRPRRLEVPPGGSARRRPRRVIVSGSGSSSTALRRGLRRLLDLIGRGGGLVDSSRLGLHDGSATGAATGAGGSAATGASGSVGVVRHRGSAPSGADHRSQLFGVRLDETAEVLEEPLLPLEEGIHRAGIRPARRGRRTGLARGCRGDGTTRCPQSVVLRDQGRQACR